MKSVAQTVIEADRFYTIAAHTGNVIQAVEGSKDGGTVRLGKYDHKPEQEWSFVREGDGVYRIRNRASGKLLDLTMTGTANGTWLHLWEDVGGTSQMWKVEHTPEGTVRLRSSWAGGKCVDTSMGLTPLEGPPMGTRCGSIDPAIVPFLMEKLNLTPAEMDTYMNKKSGMLGISGVSSDFRDLDAASKEGNERAELALQMFAYKVKQYIGSYAAALNGVDAIVFTAGVGENDRRMREMILSDMDFLGVQVDFNYNAECPRGEEVELSTKESKVHVYVIPTDEEMTIAHDTAALAL